MSHIIYYLMHIRLGAALVGKEPLAAARLARYRLAGSTGCPCDPPHSATVVPNLHDPDRPMAQDSVIHAATTLMRAAPWYWSSFSDKQEFQCMFEAPDHLCPLPKPLWFSAESQPRVTPSKRRTVAHLERGTGREAAQSDGSS